MAVQTMHNGPMDTSWFNERLSACGLTRKDLGKLLGRHGTVVSKMLKHGQPRLRLDQVVVLADALRCSVTEILVRAGPKDLADRLLDETQNQGGVTDVTPLPPPQTRAFQEALAKSRKALRDMAIFKKMKIAPGTIEEDAVMLAHIIVALSDEGREIATGIDNIIDIAQALQPIDANEKAE